MRNTLSLEINSFFPPSPSLGFSPNCLVFSFEDRVFRAQCHYKYVSFVVSSFMNEVYIWQNVPKDILLTKIKDKGIIENTYTIRRGDLIVKLDSSIGLAR